VNMTGATLRGIFTCSMQKGHAKRAEAPRFPSLPQQGHAGGPAICLHSSDRKGKASHTTESGSVRMSNVEYHPGSGVVGIH
jgi:hypothetical protein